MHRQHFTGDDPGEESINAVGYWHRFTTCKLEPRSPGSQLRPILLAAENAFENPQAFPGPAVHIGRGAQWASQLSRSSRSGQARGCAGLQSAISTCAFATDPHVLVCISVDVEGAFVPPLTSSHGFQEARGRSPASNSHVWPRDPRVSVLRSISFLSKPRPPRVGLGEARRSLNSTPGASSAVRTLRVRFTCLSARLRGARVCSSDTARYAGGCTRPAPFAPPTTLYVTRAPEALRSDPHLARFSLP